jgi:cbb3-type cytochrome oxidase subunit 3
MSAWTWIVIAIIALLIGFIVLQRRNKEAADKIASSLDDAFKKGVQDVKDATTKK